MTMNLTEIRRCAVGLLALTVFTGGTVTLAQDASGIEPPESIRAAAESFVKSQLPHDASVASVTAGALDSRLRLVRCTGGLHP